MDNYSKIYWLTRLDYLQGASIAICVISAVILLIWHLVIWVESYGIKEMKLFSKEYGNIRFNAFIILIISGVFLLFLPSKNDMILIYAGGKTLDYVQKDSSLSKIPYQTTKIVSDYLDGKIKEFDSKK